MQKDLMLLQRYTLIHGQVIHVTSKIAIFIDGDKKNTINFYKPKKINKSFFYKKKITILLSTNMDIKN